MAKLPPLSEAMKATLPDIVVDRRGANPDAFMTTIGVEGATEPRRTFRLEPAGLVISDDAPSDDALPQPEVPRSARIPCKWEHSQDTEANDANILGGFGRLVVDADEVVIPLVTATAATLAHYGARLLKHGDGLAFHGDVALPVTLMDVGPGYAEGYLNIQELGGGTYLEHHDRPHFHMPLSDDARGGLMLGKATPDGVELTLFQIPYGQAIYTPPYVLHDDGFLIGRYCVVYSLTEDFSTLIFQRDSGELVKVRPDVD